MLPALRQRPELFPHLAYVWDSFWLLSSSRHSGFGLGPIPLGEVILYFAWQGVEDPEEQDAILHLLRVMDNEYLRLTQAESEQESKPKKK